MGLIRPDFLLVQGRALPQTDDILQSFPSQWRNEFPLMRDLNFYGIEWIYDKKSEYSNPILNEDGRKQIADASKQYDIRLENIVLDWFMSYPLISDEYSTIKRMEKLSSLIDLSAKTGFKRIILPLLEENNISSIDKRNKLIEFFNNKISKQLESNEIEIHLETSLPPEDEYNLIKKLDSTKFQLCFDMGNSASFGYDPFIVINTVKDYLGSVHIKDRLVRGPSVPLGEGAVKFTTVFQCLHKINFSGPFSFQIYRNKQSNNMQILEDALIFIRNVIKEVIHE